MRRIGFENWLSAALLSLAGIILFVALLYNWAWIGTREKSALAGAGLLLLLLSAKHLIIKPSAAKSATPTGEDLSKKIAWGQIVLGLVLAVFILYDAIAKLAAKDAVWPALALFVGGLVLFQVLRVLLQIRGQR